MHNRKENHIPILAATGIVVCIRFLVATLPLPFAAPAVNAVVETSCMLPVTEFVVAVVVLVLSLSLPLTKKLFLLVVAVSVKMSQKN
jgi:hypothetical protein